VREAVLAAVWSLSQWRILTQSYIGESHEANLPLPSIPDVCLACLARNSSTESTTRCNKQHVSVTSIDTFLLRDICVQ
jgi:hypothetical protein